MKKRQIYAGIVSLVIAVVLALLNYTKIETTVGETSLVNVNIYPAAFFALLGLVLMYLGLKPLWRS